MDKKDNKNNYITRTNLEEQTQIILIALDKRLNRTDKGIDQTNNRMGRIERGMDQMETRLRKDINNVQILIDGYVKAQEDFKQEFVIMKEEIKQIKSIIKKKLGLEIKAI